MRHVAVRRHDTLCVRRVFALFLLEQRLAAFGDINYVGKTTLIVTINTDNRGGRVPLTRFVDRKPMFILFIVGRVRR